MKDVVDKVLGSKLVSRKLVVFAASTALLVGGQIPATIWVTLALAYMGAQGVVDAVEKFAAKKSD